MLPDGAALYLSVGPTGVKSWIYRYRRNGRLINTGLGPLLMVPLAKARLKAQACRGQRGDGIDPLEAKRAEQQRRRLEAVKAMSFKECAEAYIKTHKAEWRSPKSLAAWEGTLGAYVYPKFGNQPVQAVDLTLVMKALEPIWQDRSETASRLRGRIEAVLDWATVRGYRQGENPARWRGHLSHLLPARGKVRKVQHLAALPYAEVGAFIETLRRQEGIAAKALEFTILTAVRSGVTIGARWDELDLASDTWRIPGERMKSGEPHDVPLAASARALIEQMQALRQGGDFVFPGAKANRRLSDMALGMVLRRMGRDDITVHGFRATFKTWGSNETHFPRELIEEALA